MSSQSLSEALYRQRRYLRQTYTLAIVIAVLLIAFLGYCWFEPSQGDVSVFARTGSIILLIVSLWTNVTNIIRTRKFLRFFD